MESERKRALVNIPGQNIIILFVHFSLLALLYFSLIEKIFFTQAQSVLKLFKLILLFLSKVCPLLVISFTYLSVYSYAWGLYETPRQ